MDRNETLVLQVPVHISIAAIREALGLGSDIEYYTPEHNPLGSKLAWRRFCVAMTKRGELKALRTNRRWTMLKSDYHAWHQKECERRRAADPLDCRVVLGAKVTRARPKKQS